MNPASIQGLNQTLIRFESYLAGFSTASVSACGGMLHAEPAQVAQPFIVLSVNCGKQWLNGADVNDNTSMVVCALAGEDITTGAWWQRTAART